MKTMSTSTEAADRATLLTCDGRGKDAKEAALRRLITNALVSDVLKQQSTLVVTVGAKGDAAELSQMAVERQEWQDRAAALEQQLHALRLVCGTTDANRFETALDRANLRAERAEAEAAHWKEQAKADARRLDSVLWPAGSA